jgi:hypothetical protein
MITLTAPVLEKIMLAEKRIDVFLNICEGYEFEDEEDKVKVSCNRSCQRFGTLRLPFTGADQIALIQPAKMQSVADANNIMVKAIGCITWKKLKNWWQTYDTPLW